MWGETAFLIIAGATLWMLIVALVAFLAIVLCGQLEAVLSPMRRLAVLLQAAAAAWPRRRPAVGAAEGIPAGPPQPWDARVRQALSWLAERWRRSEQPHFGRPRWEPPRRDEEE